MFSILLVVPTLNSYQLLPRLVQSLQDQSFSQWRVIFIDGNSSELHKDWLRDQCKKDNRFCWEEEVNQGKGIFAAMNQGFKHASSTDWVLFWGSDDLAASHKVFNKVQQQIENMDREPDLFICSGRYFSIDRMLDGKPTSRLQRLSQFLPRQTLRRSLFLGSTPPHQATFFGPGSRKVLNSYDETFRITGDLDYFLRLSSLPNIRIFVDKSILVLMGNSGVSAKESKERYKEVIRSYKRAFGHLWFIPFVLRYIQRGWSVLTSR